MLLTTTLLKVYLLQLLLLKTCPIKKKLQDISRHSLKRQAKRQYQTYRDVGTIKPELKTTVINMLRALMNKVDKMQEQMDNVSREMEILRKETPEVKRTVTNMKKMHLMNSVDWTRLREQ